MPTLNLIFASVLVVAAAGVHAAQTTQKFDIFGRPYIGWDPLQFYCQSAPFDPLPQFWGKKCEDLKQPAMFTNN
jgi:hypothetical protein